MIHPFEQLRSDLHLLDRLRQEFAMHRETKTAPTGAPDGSLESP
jgi:hypothetical protein